LLGDRPYSRVTVIVCEAHLLLESQAVIVACPASTVPATVKALEKLPSEAEVVVTVCWVVPPCTTEIVTGLPAPKCAPVTVTVRLSSVM
jgi:hypothetical protein